MSASNDLELSIDIVGVERLKKSPVMYLIDITNSTQTWALKKRYSQLLDLHNALKKLKRFTLPVFPPKSLRNKKASFIEKRRRQLQTYVQSLLEIPGVKMTQEFRQFFEVDNKSERTQVRRNAKEDWLHRYEEMASCADLLKADIVSLRQQMAAGGDVQSLQTAIRMKLNNMTEGLATLGDDLDSGNMNITGMEKVRRKDLVVSMTTRKNDLFTEFQSARTGGSGRSADARALLGDGAAPGAAGGRGGRRRQKWGVSETEETRAMQTEELLGIQTQIMAQQDEGINQLSAILDRNLEIATAISVEVDSQNQLLDDLHAHVDSTQANIQQENRDVIKLTQRV